MPRESRAYIIWATLSFRLNGASFRRPRNLGVQSQLLDVRKPEDIAPAFDAASREHSDGLLVGVDALTQTNRKLIAELA